jgi:hypothetical protein
VAGVLEGAPGDHLEDAIDAGLQDLEPGAALAEFFVVYSLA